jgi:extradiol dioxygenase family protein
MSSSAGRITGCHHLAVCVHDIDSARVLYGDGLAIEELERPPEIATKFRNA